MKKLFKNMLIGVTAASAVIAMSTVGFAAELTSATAGDLTLTSTDGVAAISNWDTVGAVDASQYTVAIIYDNGDATISDDEIMYINQDNGSTMGTTIVNNMGTKVDLATDAAAKFAAAETAGTPLESVTYQVRVGSDVEGFTLLTGNITFTESGDVIIYGDVDEDGSVTIKDAIVAMKIDAGILTAVEPIITIGDVDGAEDGITIKDAIMIMKYDAGIITIFPCEE